MALASDPSLEKTLRAHRGAITALSWNPTGKQLASAAVDNTVVVWNFKPAQRAFRFIGHTVRDSNMRGSDVTTSRPC